MKFILACILPIIFCNAIIAEEPKQSLNTQLSEIIQKDDHDLVAFELIGRGAKKTHAMEFVINISKTPNASEAFSSIAKDNENSDAVRIYAAFGLLYLNDESYSGIAQTLTQEIGTKMVKYGEKGTILGQVDIKTIFEKIALSSSRLTK